MARKPIQWQSYVNKPTCKPVYGKKKMIKMLLAGLGSAGIGKYCELGLEKAAASGSIFKTSVTVFPPYGRPSRPITYIYKIFKTVRAISWVDRYV